ncbi:MAG: hypothetical protein IKF17_03315 [Clostridia bacterium]|nr:hypothetical protein [Clostridia bacterium]
MTDKLKSKLIIILVAIVFIVALIIGAFIINKSKINSNWQEAKSADEIVISNKDSDQVKIEKIQKKIELLNSEIEKKQEELKPEIDKLNSLYEENVKAIIESKGTTEDVENTDNVETNQEEETESVEETPTEETDEEV